MDPPPAQRARQTSETAPRRFGRQESYDMLYDESTSDAIRNRAMQGRATMNTARTLGPSRSESAIDFGSPQRPAPIFESGRDVLDRVSSQFSNRDNELQPFAASDAINGSPSRASASGAGDGFDIDENFRVDPFGSTPSPRKRSSPLKRGRADDEEAASDGMAVDGEEDECELTDVEDERPPSPTPGARGSGTMSWRGSGNSSARTLGRSRTAPEAFVTNAQF